MRELVESGRYDTREDFSVVLQPFFHNVQLPILPVCSLPSLVTLEGRRNSRQRCQVLPGSVNKMGKTQEALPGPGWWVQPP